MASVFAVVSKKVFETEAKAGGKALGLGKTWVTSKYKSVVAALNPLKEGGHLFLVTVRPPDEALWLIAVLRDVKSEKDGYSAKPNVMPITDISGFKSKIKFATGSGITAAKGKLGMSLQTPRALTEDDVKLLLSALSGAAPPPSERIWHLNGHESGPLPCLCKKCLPKSGERVEVEGVAFVRREATAKDRILYYWLPEASVPAQKAVRVAVEKRMKTKLPNPITHVPGKKKRRGGGDDEDDE
ncbi:MAG TPA: hypothetical protein VH054_03770 [Polyangiaceae bacterium]|nr:hypothetical protein [Polyangiaceae bacterium]